MTATNVDGDTSASVTITVASIEPAESAAVTGVVDGDDENSGVEVYYATDKQTEIRMPLTVPADGAKLMTDDGEMEKGGIFLIYNDIIDLVGVLTLTFKAS